MAEHGLWYIGWAGSTITGVTFLAVAGLLATNIQRAGQWRLNPLAVATMLIFLTCGTGHMLHSYQMFATWLGGSDAMQAAARLHYGEWHLWVADGATAFAGAWYLASRRRFPSLVSGAAMYENLRRQQQRALAIHDDVAQSMVKAKWRLDMKDTRGCLDELDRTQAAAAAIVDEIEATIARTRS